MSLADNFFLLNSCELSLVFVQGTDISAGLFSLIFLFLLLQASKPPKKIFASVAHAK